MAPNTAAAHKIFHSGEGSGAAAAELNNGIERGSEGRRKIHRGKICYARKVAFSARPIVSSICITATRFVAFSFHPMISRSSSPPSSEQHFRIGGDGHWNASLFLFCPATTTHPANRGRPPRSPDPTGFGPAVSRAAPGRVSPLFVRSWFFGMVERRYSRRHQDNSTRSDRLARSRD